MSGADDAVPAELARRNQELSILNAIAEALNRSVDLGQALSAVLAEVAELLGLEAGWVWLVGRAGEGEAGGVLASGATSGGEVDEVVELAAAQNLPPALLDEPERMRGSCYCLDSFRAGDMQGAANINVVACSRLAGIVEGGGGLRFHASVPLYAAGQRVGVLNVASSDYRELSRAELRLLHTIGEMLGIAVERARLFERSVEIGALEERARLARDLHDSLAQGLTGVILQLESADALLDSSAPRDHVRRILRQALEVSREALDETRRSVRGLRAAPLEQGRLAPALERLGSQAALTHGIEVQVNVDAGQRPLPRRVADALYRMAQETLSNAGRHAEARRVSLTLITGADSARLRVEDDGCGFDASDSARRDAFGLLGIEERVLQLGGELSIESAEEHGTRVEIEIPLRHAEAAR